MNTIQAVRHAPAAGASVAGPLAGLGTHLADRVTAGASAPWLTRTVILAVMTLTGLGLVTLFFIENAPNVQIVAALIALVVIVSQQKVVGDLRYGQSRLSRQLEESTMFRDQVERRSRDLESLYRSDAYLFRSLELPEVLKTLADVVTNVLHAEMCSVSVWDPEHSRLVVSATSGYAPETISELVTEPSESVVGQAFARGVPIAIADIAGDLRLQPKLSGTGGVGSFLAVPIKTSGSVFGVVGVYCSRRREFTGQEIGVYSSLAQRVGVAVENAHVFARAQQAATLAERNRLARELHDSVTQSLCGLNLIAEAGGRLASVGDLAGTQECMTRLCETAQQTSKDLRRLVYELGPLALQHGGLVGALRARLDSVERRSGIDARLVVDGVNELPPPIEHCLYRIAEQALNNSLKHARETAVRVELRAEGTTVVLAVADDGQGFDVTTILDRGGKGLGAMRDRAQLLGGTFTLESRAGHGTQVVVRLPI